MSAHLLLIEDNPADVRLVEEALRDIGAQITVHAVADGGTALRIARGEEAVPEPDVILLDLNLPVARGLEVLTTMRRSDRFAHVPIVILTTSDAEADVREAYRLGASAFIVKPVGFEDFLSAVRRFADFWLRTATLPPRLVPRA